MITDIDLLFPDRSQTKQDITSLQAEIELLLSDVEVDKSILYNGHSFVCKSSDQKGRNLEFKKACKDDPDISSKENKLRSLQIDLRDKERILSEINYDQRERLIDSMSNVSGVVRHFTEALKGFTDTVKEFNSAVDKLIESRKK